MASVRLNCMAFLKSGVSKLLFAFFFRCDAGISFPFRLYLSALADWTAVRTWWKGRRKEGVCIVCVRTCDIADREMEERHDGQYRAVAIVMCIVRGRMRCYRRCWRRSCAGAENLGGVFRDQVHNYQLGSANFPSSLLASRRPHFYTYQRLHVHVLLHHPYACLVAPRHDE